MHESVSDVYLSNEELNELEENLKKDASVVIQKASEKGRLSIVVMFNNGQHAALKIVENDNTYHLATVLSNVYYEPQESQPEGLEIKINEPTLTIANIAASIKPFIQNNFDQSNFRINLFESIHSHKLKTPDAWITKTGQVKLAADKLKPVFLNY